MRSTKYRLDFNSEIITKIYQKVIMNEKLQLEVKNLRRQFTIPEFGTAPFQDMLAFRKNTNLIKAVKKLLLKFKLPVTWDDLVLKYIIQDDFMPDYDPNGLFLEVRNGKTDAEKQYYLRIFQDTSIKDIRDAWPHIRKIMRGKDTKKKTDKYFNRNIDMYRLHKEGKSIGEICSFIENRYPGKDLDYGLIKKIISDYKKLAKGEK